MKSLDFYENHITLFCLENSKLFDNIILTLNLHCILPKVVEITIWYKQQLRNNAILSHDLFRNAQQCDAPFHGAGVSGSTIM
jgi:hypothetical protein